MCKEKELLKKILATGWLNHELSCEVDDLIAQPEQEPVAWMQDSIELYVLEEKSAIRGYVIPLYTSPPKPLTPREALTEYKKGYARAELDLKREPIKGGELKVWYSQHTWAMDEQEYTWGFRAYMAGCRDAEKVHGIGVDDE